MSDASRGGDTGAGSGARPPGERDTARAAERLAARLPDELAPLARLAFDLSWSWEPGGAELFRSVDPLRWERVIHNPIRLLLETPISRLKAVARDRDLLQRFVALESRLAARRAEPLEAPGAGPSASRPVAFLCAEFGAHCSLPIYAGGLGLLAGDLLREAADRAFPMVGLGLYYREGYFRQRLDPSGRQHEYWIERHPELRPLALVTNGAGEELTVPVRIRDREVRLQVWRAELGRASLYLLDADRPENRIIDRWITTRLYDSDSEVRLAQYAALGIGGMRALAAMGIEPSVVHLNEGHAALASLELLREGVKAGISVDAAAKTVREKIVFTTHTPVAAGNEGYTAAELHNVLGHLPEELGLTPEELAGMGRIHPDDAHEPFRLTVLALRNGRASNGVSRIHGGVAREMWRGLWPDQPVDEVPIRHVTNGAHLPGWMAPPMRRLLARHLGEGFERRAADPATWEPVVGIPDEELWATRGALRRALVEFVRERTVEDRLRRGEPMAYVEEAARNFDPDVLTVGFARRLATYKRLHLLASDARRALGLLRGERPIQIVIAGKAHPRDEEAKGVLQRLFGLKREPTVGGRVAFLEDYDAVTASRLVSGCDVWLNLPRPPLEASGTSGMKSAFNGGLQLSVLDGWWAEAWNGDNGWAVAADPAPDEAARDARDAARVFDLLEGEVGTLFYERDAGGIPRGWVRRIKESLRSIGPRFCATRMLDDYARDVYPS